jgi:hypothetical protein
MEGVMSVGLAMQMNYQEWKAYAKKLETMVETLQGQLNVKDAEIAGLLAQVQAMRQAHQDSPLLQATNEVFVTDQKLKGQKKTKLRKVYENAFDTKAREKGITKPETIRTN